MERIAIAPGIAMPFVPPRPHPGPLLLSPTRAVAQLAEDVAEGWIVQGKLNGDRACVGVAAAGGQVIAQNRHLGWFRHRINNLGAFSIFGPGLCLDGEVEAGIFYPFECVALNGRSYVQAKTSERVALAKDLCAQAGVPYIFDAPTPAAIRRLRKNLPRWEGYVAKRDAYYPIGGTVTQETSLWRKCKF